MVIDSATETQEKRDRELRLAKAHKKAGDSGKKRSDDEEEERRAMKRECEPEDSEHSGTQK